LPITRIPYARVIAFNVTAFAQLALAVAFRSRSRTLPEIGFLRNRPLLGALVVAALLQIAVVEFAPLQPFFAIVRPPAADWLLLIPIALAPVTVIELGKMLARRPRRAATLAPARAGRV
jgi:P-type Ca2+ transporter type 2C